MRKIMSFEQLPHLLSLKFSFELVSGFTKGFLAVNIVFSEFWEHSVQNIVSRECSEEH